MQSRFSTGWRVTLSATAAIALVLPLTIAFGASLERAEESLVDVIAELPKYSRSNYVWPHASGPFYGRVSKSMQGESGVFHTMVGSFDLRQGTPNFPDSLRATNRVSQLGHQYFVVQLDTAVAKAGGLVGLRSKLEEAGGAIVRSMKVNSYITRLTADAYDALRGAHGVVAVEPYHPAFKLDPTIGRTPLQDPVKALSEVYALDVMLFKGENAEDVANEIRRMGGDVKAVWGDSLRVEVHRGKMPNLASVQGVYRIHEALPVLPFAEETTTTIMTGQWNQGATPYHDAGINGGGGGIAAAQSLMILDTGIQLDAGDLSHTATDAGETSPGSSAPIPGHRKVAFYGTTINFQGNGDGAGCDFPQQGGFTHGHMVAGVALGNASTVDPGYGDPYLVLDQNDNSWKLDGVAPGAMLVAYDGQVTPSSVSCADPLLGQINPGDLYTAPGSGSMAEAYGNGARIYNFSFGLDANIYSVLADDTDQFLYDFPNTMAFVAVGNAGVDGNQDDVTDPSTARTPGNAKNIVSVGASRNANDVGTNFQGPGDRAGFSSSGPAPGNRIVPILMAPGSDPGNMGIQSEWVCRSGDNDQSDPVECDLRSGQAGTSFSSPAAAGAALLVRDYFAQGAYPDGTTSNPGNSADQVADISGALVKSILIASAEFMEGQGFIGQTQFGGNLTMPWRFNREQGYGRIKLDNVLPLQTWASSASGLIVADGGIDGGPNNLSGLSGDLNTLTGETDTATFELCDSSQELKVAVSWIEPSGEDMINNIDLELCAPANPPCSGKVYYGNYFTDDNDLSGGVDAGEDCPGFDGTTGELDQSGFSLPRCANSARDSLNPTEAIFLSPDPDGNDDTEDGLSQTDAGTWTVRVIGNSGGDTAQQRYAVAVAGGVCLGSSVKLNQGTYVCNDSVEVTVNEIDEADDPGAGLSPTSVSARTTVQVIGFDLCDDLFTSCSGDSDCTGIGSGTCNAELKVDSESGINFSQDALKFTSDELLLSDGTTFDSNNGVLDVRDGYEIRVLYDDQSNGAPTLDKQRLSSAAIGCKVNIGVGAIVFGQFGFNPTFLVLGGCERNARGQFEFGFPDRYMDEGELISYRFAFASEEQLDLENVQVALRCVEIDADSPVDCRPGTTDCADPNRENNATCSEMTILDTPRTIGSLTAGSAISANFTIQMADTIVGSPTREMVLEATAGISGKTAKAVGINLHQLNVDEVSQYYSTDFPTGGTELRDGVCAECSLRSANNEFIEGLRVSGTGDSGEPTTVVGDFRRDYVFEERVFSDLTAGGSKNTDLQAPWNFDTSNGGFTSGLLSTTDEAAIADTIALWGEDKNFNGVNDRRCSLNQAFACEIDADCPSGFGICSSIEDRDPENGQLDANWSTAGGCGWQTKAPNTCSNNPNQGCYSDADCAGGSCSEAGPLTGGVWHTGRIGGTTGDCLVAGNDPGQCQAYETVSGNTGQRQWNEALLTPVIEKVNTDVDANGNPTHALELVFWSWNWSSDIADNNASWAFEIDTDVTKIEPVDLLSDNAFNRQLFGGYGAVTNENNPRLSDGFGMFAPLDSNGNSVNGTVGRNREGKNSCFFEGGAVPAANLTRDIFGRWETIGLAKPLDDDLDNGHCVESNNFQCTRTCELDQGNCSVGGNTCVGDGDCPLASCSVDGSICTTDGDCPNDDVCTGKICSNTGDPCSDDPDCGAGFCDGTCSDSGDPCFGPPGEEPQCAGPDTCVAESCTGISFVRCNTNADCAGETPSLGDCTSETPDCAGNTCESGTCSATGDSCTTNADCQCVITNQQAGETVDEYVRPNGPLRNMTIRAVNGLDMRLNTLEDFIGEPSGDTIQGSIILRTFEKISPSRPDPQSGYGLAIDDMVVEWREFALGEDQSECSAGECATIDTESTNLYEGSTLITVTVIERSPPAANDCDGDGMTDGTNDCDGNGVADLVVVATSDDELAGERVFLNNTGVPGEYKGSVAVSIFADAPGVLFVQGGGGLGGGGANPQVDILYIDDDDGTDNICTNSVDPANQGRLQVSTTLFTQAANVTVINTVLTDNGDNDGWADTNETVNMRVTLSNKTNVDMTNLVARLATNDPKIDCIINPTVLVPSLPAGEQLLTDAAFTFRVGDVDRTTSGLSNLDDFSALFSVLMSAEEFDSILIPQQIVLDLDLDATGGAGPQTYFEGFESGDFGTFTSMNLDQGKNNLSDSDGYRCQYHDPTWIQANSYGNLSDCWLAANNNPAHADALFFQVNGPTDIDGGRSFTGTHSLYYGVFGAAADEHTTPMGELNALRSNAPININFAKVCQTNRTKACATDADCNAPGDGSCVGVTPELTLYHQISHLDERGVNAQTGRSAGRSVVQVQLADTAGDPVGDWIKIAPYLNVYDTQSEDNYFNCFFDPIDDGNDEDDFFDPADPNRRLGPSSTCFPEFNFAYLGDTFEQNSFGATNIGRASDGPGLEGATGAGTWIESVFNLERFRGRSLRIRFVTTNLKAGGFTTWESIFGDNPEPTDDGWWIDDITVTDALSPDSPAVVSNDDKANAGFPECGTTCGSVTAALTSDPASSPAPGQVVELDATGSSADRCLNGSLQYQFWVDGNGNNIGGDAQDTLLRGFTDVGTLTDAPQGPNNYVVDVRCSTDNSCAGSTNLNFSVSCPPAGLGSFAMPITAPDKDTFSWMTSVTAEAIVGDLVALRSSGDFTGTFGAVQTLGVATSLDVSGVNPGTSAANYVLLREILGGSSCNSGQAAQWDSGGSAQVGDRDAVLP